MPWCPVSLETQSNCTLVTFAFYSTDCLILKLWKVSQLSVAVVLGGQQFHIVLGIFIRINIFVI